MNPTTPTTELEAVNLALSVIGELPVDDLRLADTNADVKMALMLLRSGTRTLTLRGWKFNTDTARTLYRDPDLSIPLPANAVRCIPNEDAGQDVDLTIRGQRLWNRKTHSFSWDLDLICDVTYLLPFGDLPEPARDYLSQKISQRFQARALGSPTLDSFTREDLEDAKSVLMDFELDDGDYNFLTGSKSVAGAWVR